MKKIFATFSILALTLVINGCAQSNQTMNTSKTTWTLDQSIKVPSKSNFPENFQGDGMSSIAIGEKSFEIISPDKSRKAYVVRGSDGSDDLFLEGPDGQKELLANGSNWPVGFSPDSLMFVYVSEARISDVRFPNSVFVYRIASGKNEQLTNTAPNLAELNEKDFSYQLIGEPLNDLQWNGHTFKYNSKNAAGAEEITIDLDTSKVVRNPIGAN